MQDTFEKLDQLAKEAAQHEYVALEPLLRITMTTLIVEVPSSKTLVHPLPARCRQALFLLLFIQFIHFKTLLKYVT